MSRRRVALDLETFEFGLEHGPHPPPVAFAFAWRDEAGELQRWLFGDGDEGVESWIDRLFRDPSIEVVTHRGAYDLGVLAQHRPRLRPAIHALLREGRLTCTRVREVLLAISTTGRIREDERGQPVGYGLADLVVRYFGRDRREEKVDARGWRRRFVELAGRPAREYPPEAAEYALADAVDTLLVAEAQDGMGHGSTRTEDLHAAADYCLARTTCRGLELDPAMVEWMAGRVGEERDPARFESLVDAGILRPGHPGQPHSGGHRDHAEGCDGFGCSCDGTTPKGNRRHVRGCARPRCACPVKMTAPEPPSVCEAVLHERVLAACHDADLEVVLTDKGVEELGHEKLPPSEVPRDPRSGRPLYVSTQREFLNELAVHDPVLYDYRHRKSLDKLEQSVSIMADALVAGHPVIHPNYDVLKETSRTSSYGGRRGVPVGEDGNPYPSKNVQQEPNPPKKKVEGLEFLDELDTRLCYRPRPGTLFIIADFSSLELVTTAQRTHELREVLGVDSVHRQILNSGRNCHTFLGAQIVYELGGDAFPELVEKFRRRRDVRRAARAGDRVAIGDAFAEYARADGKRERKFYKHYRTTAKPFGLGFPGGMGPRKMAYKVAPQYDVYVTVEQSSAFRSLWRAAYPEMPRYHRWVSTALRQDDGSYRYETPFGFVRAGCTFTAACNGDAMQTRGSDAAKIALVRVTAAAEDPSEGSILCGSYWPVAYIHDEVVGEVVDDDLAHWRALEVARIMERALALVCPDVHGEVEPVLATRWSKSAEPTRGPLGLLIPWSPAPVEGRPPTS